MRKFRRESIGYDSPQVSEEARGHSLSEMLAFGIAGITLTVGVAITGHYLGQQASASAALPKQQWSDATLPSATPASTIARKSSLLQAPAEYELRLQMASLRPEVLSGGKGDFEVAPEVIEPQEQLARLDQMIVTPSIGQLERNWKVGTERKRRIMQARKRRLAGMSCLSRAIYFEARSESELGQLAVAKVIMNRVKSKVYPNTICDVVYQGAHRRNSCQFSFACDGSADNPRPGKAWRQAQRVAKRAINGASDVRVISTATHYHADYVNPRWSGAMKRLIKIGKHIFYHDS